MNATLSYQPHWVREDFVDFVLQKINVTWAWKRVLAEVTAVQPACIPIWFIRLKPNRNFNFDQVRAGQSILLTLLIDGVYQQRSYSIIEVTLKVKLL